MSGLGAPFGEEEGGWADPGVCAVQVQEEEAASAPTVGMVLGSGAWGNPFVWDMGLCSPKCLAGSCCFPSASSGRIKQPHERLSPSYNIPSQQTLEGNAWAFFFFDITWHLKISSTYFAFFFPFPSWKILTDFCFFFFFPPIRKPSQASGFLGSGGAGDGKQPGPHPRVGTAGAAAAGSALGAEQHKRPI